MMRKMLALPLFVAFVLVGCSDSEPGVAVQHNKLALAVPNPTDVSGQSSLLLFENGTQAIPVKGVEAANALEIGKTYLVSYARVGSQNSVDQIDVRTFGEAKDSVFVPQNPELRVNAEAKISGKYVGSFYAFDADSITTRIGRASLKLNGGSYSYTVEELTGSTPGTTISGSGSFSIINNTDPYLNPELILNHAGNAPESDLKLSGNYFISLHGAYLTLWVNSNGAFKSYSFKKD